MSSNRDKILYNISKDKQWKQTCRNIVNSQSLFDYQNDRFVDNDYLAEELYSEFLLSICEMDEEKLIHLHDKGELKFYLLRIIVNQYKSNSSRYFRQIKKKYTTIIDYSNLLEEFNDDETIITDLSNTWLKFLNEKIDKLFWYDKIIFQMYINDGLSMKKIADKIGIPESSIKSTIKSVRNYLKECVQNARRGQ